MNTRRILFWLGFVVILGLIIWGLIAAEKKDKDNPDFPIVTLSTEEALVKSTDHILGPSDAKVTIIEYSDLQCPACRTYAPVVKQLVADGSLSEQASSSIPSVRLVYRHFPLPIHKNALIAGQAAEAASIQGKFWEMETVIYENQDKWDEEADPRPMFAKYAEEMGLNVTQFNTDMNSDIVKNIVNDSIEKGKVIGISYTPSFFINGKLIQNPPSYEAFKQIIRSASSSNSN